MKNEKKKMFATQLRRQSMFDGNIQERVQIKMGIGKEGERWEKESNRGDKVEMEEWMELLDKEGRNGREERHGQQAERRAQRVLAEERTGPRRRSSAGPDKQQTEESVKNKKGERERSR